MTPAFEYYEVVKIVRCAGMPELVGKQGHIAGKSYDDGGPVEGYGVWLPDLEEVVCVGLDEIESLGSFVDPEEFRTGVSIRVKNVDGRGVLVEES